VGLTTHGTDDPLIRVSGGRATAEAVPRACWWRSSGCHTTSPRAVARHHRPDRGSGGESGRLAAWGPTCT